MSKGGYLNWKKVCAGSDFECTARMGKSVTPKPLGFRLWRGQFFTPVTRPADSEEPPESGSFVAVSTEIFSIAI
jgi:hypothetical protein